jgi:hypothetical protein
MLLNAHPGDTFRASLLAQTVPLPENCGYQEAHKFYDEMRAHMASRAYASDVPEVISIKVDLKYMRSGKSTPVLIAVSQFQYFSSKLYE